MSDSSTTLDTPPEAPALPMETIFHIRDLHAKAARSAQDSVLWSALCGLDLRTIRDSLEHGQWGQWVEENCGFTVRTAGNYIQAAERAEAGLRAHMQCAHVTDEDVRENLLIALESEDPATRARLIEACRKPKPALPPAPAKAPRAPRPPAPPEKIARRFCTRILVAPPQVREVLFTELRPEFERWLAEHPTR